jgi:hypothetical protein
MTTASIAIPNPVEMLLNGMADLTKALNLVAGNQERLIAGQAAAMEKLEGGATATSGRKPRGSSSSSSSKPAEAAEPVVAAPVVETKPAVHVLLASPNASTKKNAKGEDEATGAYRAAAFTREELKNETIGWLGDTTDAAERKARMEFVKAMADHFGVKQLLAADGGISEPEQFKQALFYLRRKRAGLAVNFSQDYDFDADPLADTTPEPAAEDVDALG